MQNSIAAPHAGQIEGAGLLTQALFFHSCGQKGPPLYRVCEGVPLERALEHASNLLDSAYDVARRALESGATVQAAASLRTILHLLEPARATLDASIIGLDPLN